MDRYWRRRRALRFFRNGSLREKILGKELICQNLLMTGAVIARGEASLAALLRIAAKLIRD